jgi:outer membrane lipopolysaccharide assembly protein LptE/RlpB
MKKIFILLTILSLVSCGYHLRANNSIAENHPEIKLNINAQSLLKRPLINALLSSNVKLTDESSETISELKILKDSLNKVVQSIGANNQVQEYRLEYDVEFSLADSKIHEIHIEKDYSFDIQQIGGGQSEEIALRKQLAEDMAWAIIRQISVFKNTEK